MDTITKLLNDLSPGKTVGIGVATGLVLFLAESCISCFAKKVCQGTDGKSKRILKQSMVTEANHEVEVQTNLRLIKGIS